jgi:hypothetical protein
MIFTKQTHLNPLSSEQRHSSSKQIAQKVNRGAQKYRGFEFWQKLDDSGI